MRPSHPESRFCLLAGLLVLLALAWPAQAQEAEKRIALVIGTAAYADGALPTTANDAGLIAEQLQAAGFDVSGARDLNGDELRSAFRDFVDKARQSGPDTVAFVYFAGYGLQFDGENYVVPIDAKIPTAADTPIQAMRITDLMRPLAELQMKGRIVVLDAARENPFAREGQPLASGLALVEPDPGTLIAFNAAPGTVAPPEQGEAYGPYARALAEMIRQGGLPLKDVFDEVRLRVSDLSRGAVVPWDADRVEAPFLFFDRAPNAPTPPPNAGLSSLRDRPLRDLGPAEAYQAALDRDTLQAYQEFLDAYTSDPMAKRVRAILAARREEATWRITLQNGTADAYWSYLRRYPRGPHVADCHRRLARLAVALEPPPDFQEIAYDLPPPPPEEIAIVDQPALTFADFDLPPPPPVIVLAPPPPYFIDLPPPPPPVDDFVLPVPAYEPLPVWVDLPPYVAPPPVNIIFYNIHNTVIVNTVQNTVIVKNPAGQPVPPFANAVAAGVLPRNATPLLLGANAAGPQAEPQVKPDAPRVSPGFSAGVGAALGAGAAAAALHAALPPSVAARAQQAPRPGVVGPNRRAPAPGQQAPLLPGEARPGQPGASPSAPGGFEHALPGQLQPGQQAAHPLPGQALPGQHIQPTQGQPGQIRPAPLATGQARPAVSEQQLQQQRAQQMQQEPAQQVQQQRAQQMQQERAQQMQQERAQQVQQQRAQQMQQERAQQMQQERAQQMQQERAQQVQQQRAQQMQQERAQQMQIQMQREQQAQRQRQAPGPQCGRPGQPPCR